MIQIDPNRWYTIKDLEDLGVILGMKSVGIRRVIAKGHRGTRLKARRTSVNGHWRILGRHLQEFLRDS